jgi:2-polyprenyl-3-methyl-5-hydroxy-6-metoxy-1,4-benzoquinol methylase
MRGTPWNHNIQYFPFIVETVRAHASERVLDVGSGDGMLAARLSGAAPNVLGIDIDRERVDAATARYARVNGLDFRTVDVLEFEGVFDAVTCSATVHHLDLETALMKLAALTAPGGVLVVVGLANDATTLDRIRSHGVAVVNRIQRARRGWHDHGSHRENPRNSWAETRAIAERILPGVQYRRRFYWRYSLVWERPIATS